MPVIFSPVDPKSLFLGSNVLFKTTTGGRSWEIISPDLTRETYEVPTNLGIFTPLDPEKGKHRGVIYTVAPSFRNAAIIWAGTDDGLIHVTRDGGKSWKDVTPAALTPWSKVSLLTASHFDDETAYAAVNRFRLDDLRPHIYRTHDGGRTWTEITRGIPENEVVNAVREDPVRKGMLYAGSERAVYVSWDDGDNWESLRLNMPATSIRDLVIHDDDIVVGTHGRSFWILDDISPLRQMTQATGKSAAILFRPRLSYRFRRNKNTDTPLPPEEPVGKNPPDGAIIYYYLGVQPRSPVTISIRDATGKLIRAFSSSNKPDSIPADLNVPLYWVRPFHPVSAAGGMHRFVWELHYVPPSVSGFSYPISAIVHDTPLEPLGPAVAPGEYQVTLSVGGKSYTQPLTVRMDPRSQMTLAELVEQERIGLAMLDATRVTWSALGEVRKLRTTIADVRAKGGPKAPPDIVTAVAALEPRLAGIETGVAPAAGLVRLNAEAAALLGNVEGADMPLTAQTLTKAAEITRNVSSLLANWRTLQAEVDRMNSSVRKALGR